MGRPTFSIFASLVTFFLVHGVKGDACESTWNLYDDRCFKVFHEIVVQAEAQEYCGSLGARLPTALATKLKDILVLLTRGNGNSTYWCVSRKGKIHAGLLYNISTVSTHTMITSPKFTVTTHPMITSLKHSVTTNPMITSRKPMSPTENPEESCYYLQDKELHVGDCNVPRNFICEKDAIIPPVTCPEETEKVGTYCFWRTSDLLNKEKAEEACSEKGGRLANLEFRRKRAYAIATVILRRQNLWVGANKDQGKIKWANGHIMNPETEETYIPIKDEGGKCVILGMNEDSESGTSWILGNCSRAAYGLCEKEGELEIVTVQPTSTIEETTTPPTCPGYGRDDKEKDGICYWETTYETSLLDWETARKFCQSYGGDLASYKDAAEEEFALGSAKGHTHGLWTGLRREPNSNVFRWSDGSDLTYTNWAPEQPNLKGNLKLCVAHIGKNSAWEVMNCAVHRWFVCKIPKDKIPYSPVQPTQETFRECSRHTSSSLLKWTYYQGYCYIFSMRQHFSWDTAKRFCQDNGAHLTSIHSFEELNFFLQLFATSQSRHNVWLGLRAKGLHSSYRWDDGTPLNFVNWDEDDPYDDRSSTDTCVVLELLSGSWMKTHCNQLEYVTCKAQDEINHTFTAAPTLNLPGYCPDDWYMFGNKCYRAFGLKHKTTWSEANRKCADIGSQLVSIHSQEEQNFLELILLAIQWSAWIGMYSTVGGRLFHWTDKSSMDYTNWDSGEPSYLNEREECVEMVFDDRQEKMGKWNDHQCTMFYPFICQIPKDPMLTKPGRDAFLCSDPENWIKLGSSCYQIFNRSDNSLTWLQAQSYCMSLKANLASIRNKAVSTHLRHYLSGTTGIFWIGMGDTTYHVYRWIGSTAQVTYSNWLQGQPKEVSPLHNCVAMNADGKWMVRNCDESHPFICEDNKEPPTVAPDEPDLVCPNTTKLWKDLGGKFCYIFEISSKVSWYHAAHYCFGQGGNLASLHSESEMEAVLHHIKESDMPVHIGLAQKEDGSYGWFDGTALDYVHWSPGEPNDSGEMCVEMHSDLGTWNDVKCTEKRGYVCMTRKVPKNVTSTGSLTDEGNDLQTRVTAGGVVGIIICILVVLVIIAVAVYYICPPKRIRARRQTETSQL